MPEIAQTTPLQDQEFVVQQLQQLIAELYARLEDFDISESDEKSVQMQLSAAEKDLVTEKGKLAELNLGFTPESKASLTTQLASSVPYLPQPETTEGKKRYATLKHHNNAPSKEVQVVAENAIIDHGVEMGLSAVYAKRVLEALPPIITLQRDWQTMDSWMETMDNAIAEASEIAQRLGLKATFEPESEDDFDRVVNWRLSIGEEIERRKLQLEKIIGMLNHNLDYLQRRYQPRLSAFVLANAKQGQKCYHFLSGSVYLIDSSGGLVLDDTAAGVRARQEFYASLSDKQRADLKINKEVQTVYKHESLPEVYKYLRDLKDKPKGFIDKPPSQTVSIRSPKGK